MKKLSFSELKANVIDKELCTRCGMCIGVCPFKSLEIGRDAYPILISECKSCGLCSSCCPGAKVDFPLLSRTLFNEDYSNDNIQGHVERIFVAYPKNDQIRMTGASGGIVTAILAHLLDKGEIDGAIVVGMDEQFPVKTKGVLAKTYNELLSSAQSKYCVTPSLAMLSEIRQMEGKFAVVALPCQTHALRKLQQNDPGLAKKIKYIFGLYCHCTLEPNGHEEAITTFGIPLSDVKSFQFRGGGWPGGFFVVTKSGKQISLHQDILIKDTMNVMFRLYGPKRCQLCTDALCEFADLSFGDFWAFDFAEDLSGFERSTLISERTSVGHDLMENLQRSSDFVVHQIPSIRNSKRILRMAQGKKGRAYANISKKINKHQPVPDFSINLPDPTFFDKKNAFMFSLFQKISSKLFRKTILSLFFSPFGVFFYKINTMRKKIFIDYKS